LLTKCLAKALAPDVRVNAICGRGRFRCRVIPPEWEQEFVKLGAAAEKRGGPSDIADAVIYIWLRAEFLTGHTPGGWMAGRVA